MFQGKKKSTGQDIRTGDGGGSLSRGLTEKVTIRQTQILEGRALQVKTLQRAQLVGSRKRQQSREAGRG